MSSSFLEPDEGTAPRVDEMENINGSEKSFFSSYSFSGMWEYVLFGCRTMWCFMSYGKNLNAGLLRMRHINGGDVAN
jgi:hypothetical protein